MNRSARLGFISAMTKDQTGSGYAPRYAIFAKGDDAAKAFCEVQQRAIGDDVTKLRQYGFFRLTRAWVKMKD